MIILSFIALFLSFLFFAYTKYSYLLETNVSLDKTEKIYPTDPIVINFSNPIVTKYLNLSLEVYPKTEVDYRWENKNRRLIITPKKYWSPENGYNIQISGRNAFLLPVKKDAYFSTIPYPKITDFYPASGSKDVVLDIEDPIKANFDSSLDDFKVKFVVNPFQDFNYNIDSGNNRIDLMPKEDFKKGEKYSVGIYIKYKKEDENNYRKISETFFETKPVAPTVWEKDFNARLEQARKFTEAKIEEGKYIDINLKIQVLTIFENGKLLDAYMISSGKRGMETPQGSFQVSNKTPRAWSKKYGLFMPYWMAIVKSGDFGIHELPEWPGGYKEGVNHLGIPVSHGCVRLGVGPAERVYTWAEIGTPIIIHS